MPINFGDAPRFPYLRFNVQTNTWAIPGDGGPQEIELFGKPLALDPETGLKGWLTIQTGSREWVPIPGPVNGIMPKAPSELAKVGFSLFVFAPKTFGDERAYECCNNSAAWRDFIKKLFIKCEPRFGKDEVPLVVMSGAESVKKGAGTSRDIAFAIKEWIPRPQAIIDALAERDAANRDNGAADYTSAKAGRPVIVSSGKKPDAFKDIEDDSIPFAHAVPREFQKDVEHPLTGVRFK